MTTTMILTHPADRTTVHQVSDAVQNAYQVENAIPATSDAALAYLAGERAAGVYLSRIVNDQVQPGELAARVGVAHDPGLAGFLARVQKALTAHLREVS